MISLNIFSLLDRSKMPISYRERKRLRKIERYIQVKTNLFGVPLIANDSCTLLSDIYSILEKEIYRFSSNKKNPLILDCGANIGISTIYFKRIYPESTVVAFEPDPVLYHMLNKNIYSFQFNDVETNQSAIWINNDGIDFYIEGGHSGRIANLHDNDCKNKIISVSTISLKDMLKSYESIDMLKIDIEGAEEEVLFDCGDHLKKCEHIFVEYHSDAKKRQKLHEILTLFNKIGYRYHIQEAFSREKPFIDTRVIAGMDLQLNLFFYKKNCS